MCAISDENILDMQLLSLVLFTLILMIFFTVDCQYTFLDTKFGPFVKIARLFASDLIKPRTFELGYQINLRNGVSFCCKDFEDE